MDITFNCAKCGQHVAIDEAGEGQLVDCPKCGTPLEVPFQSKPVAESVTPAERRAMLRERYKSQPLAEPVTPAPVMPTGEPASVSLKTFVLSFIIAGVSVLILGVVFYLAVAKPLRTQVRELTTTVNHNAEVANRATKALADTVNHNAEVANRNTQIVADGLKSLSDTVSVNAKSANSSTRNLANALDSLTGTVNNNAESANSTTRKLANALDSLTDTVNHNARTANFNNLLR